MPARQNSTVSETFQILKFNLWNLKKSKNYFSSKISLTKQFSLIDLHAVTNTVKS